MPAYMIAIENVTDAEKQEEWRRRILPVIKRNGGRIVLRSRSVEVLDGDVKPTGVAIISFPNWDAVRRVRQATEGEISNLRRSAGSGIVLLVDGEA